MNFNFGKPAGSNTSTFSFGANKNNASTASKPSGFSFNFPKPSGSNTAAAPSKPTTPATPAASTASPAATPASALSQAGTSVSTAGTTASPIQVTIQEKDGSTKQGVSTSICNNDKFKQYSLLELRVFDYISQNKVEKLKPPPAAPAAAAAATATNSATGAAAPSFTSSLFNTKQTTGNTLGGTSFSIAKTINTATVDNDGLDDKAIKEAQGLPSTIPAKIFTAAEFFKPNIPKLKKIQISETSTRRNEQPQFIDYSILFKPRISSSHRAKSAVTPIIITDKMLNRGPEEEPSTLRFAPSYVDEEDYDDIKIHPSIKEYPRPSMENLVASNELTLYPPLNKIQVLTDVKNFRISKDTVATIDFLSPVDISHFNFKKDIIIRSCLVDVYRLKKNIPKKGTGMNVSAMINMHSTWPKNLMSGIRERTKNMKILSQYEEQLKNFCEKKNAQFLFYLKDKGIFQFIVPDFTNGPFDLP